MSRQATNTYWEATGRKREHKSILWRRFRSIPFSIDPPSLSILSESFFFIPLLIFWLVFFFFFLKKKKKKKFFFFFFLAFFLSKAFFNPIIEKPEDCVTQKKIINEIFFVFTLAKVSIFLGTRRLCYAEKTKKTTIITPSVYYYIVCTHNLIRSPRLAAFGRTATLRVREVGKFGPYSRYKDWLRRRLLVNIF